MNHTRGTNRSPVLTAMTCLVLALWACANAGSADEPATSGPRRMTLGRPFACADYGGSKICLVDKDGRITWEYPATGPQDVWVLPNGNILFSHVKGATEVTRQKEVVWEYKTAEANEVHACQPLPDGVVMVAESGPMRIVEVDRDGKITQRGPIEDQLHEHASADALRPQARHGKLSRGSVSRRRCPRV